MIPAGFRLQYGARTWDASQISRAADALARVLRDAGIRGREPVTLQAPNEPATVAALLALDRLGAATVPIHHQAPPTEAQRLHERVRARVHLAHPDLAVAYAAGLRARTMPLLDPDAAPPPAPRIAGDAARVGADYIIHTSGTTGRPKGALLTHEAFTAHAKAAAERLPVRPDDAWLATLPFAHVGGLALLHRTLLHGLRLVIPPPRAGPDLDPLISQHAVTHVSLVPTQLRRWLDHRHAGPAPSTMRAILLGGAPIPPRLVANARDAGFPIHPTYGRTESCSQVATAHLHDPPDSVGTPLAGAGVQLRDDRDEPLTAHAVGRIHVRAPWLFIGYHDDPAATRDALRGGWLRTDDLGRLDDQGRLHVIGRLGDRIITGGENVDPAEVEAVLETHPDVDQACVIGVPDTEWGQRVLALIVPRGNTRPDAAVLRDHCAATLARFKCPREVRLVADLPRTPGGKLRRADARATVT